jgi:hypothetical protein
LSSNNTQTGSNVTLSTSSTYTNPSTGQTSPVSSTITFDNVTSPGLTTVNVASDAGGDVPTNFAAGINAYTAAFVDVSTTATYTGNVTVCLGYPDADNDGNIDGTSPAVPETSLRLFHREDGVFVDRTNEPVDYAANIICATVSSLSPFAALPQTDVPGGKGGSTDCITEARLRRNPFSLLDSAADLPTIPFKKGLPDGNKISCRDGDPCDADEVAGQCTFTVSICPNQTDNRFACTPTNVARYVVKKPNPAKPKDQTDTANAGALVGELAALGASSVSGNQVTYSPSLTSSSCSDPFSFVVPLKLGKKANRQIQLDALTASGIADKNKLKLTCLP